MDRSCQSDELVKEKKRIAPVFGIPMLELLHEVASDFCKLFIDVVRDNFVQIELRMLLRAQY